MLYQSKQRGGNKKRICLFKAIFQKRRYRHNKCTKISLFPIKKNCNYTNY